LQFKRKAGTQGNKTLHAVIKASEYKGYRHFFSEIAKANTAFEAYKKARAERVKAHKAELAENASEKATKAPVKVAIK
jgi:hypothetical protein